MNIEESHQREKYFSSSLPKTTPFPLVKIKFNKYKLHFTFSGSVCLWKNQETRMWPYFKSEQYSEKAVINKLLYL